MLELSVSLFIYGVHLYVTVCCGFPPGSDTDRNGLSMLSNELSPAQSPGSKVRTKFLIGQLTLNDLFLLYSMLAETRVDNLQLFSLNI